MTQYEWRVSGKYIEYLLSTSKLPTASMVEVVGPSSDRLS
jgi:hypothetical protein